LKMYQDMKGYADELESAFNGLHGRYTKLKEYYTASDANNQVSFRIFMCVCVCVYTYTHTYAYHTKPALNAAASLLSMPLHLRSQLRRRRSLLLLLQACSQSSCGCRRTCLNRICVRVCVLWQVLSKNLLEANELLKSHQTQLKATQDKMKALEDHHIAGKK